MCNVHGSRIDRAKPFAIYRRHVGPRDGSALEPWMRDQQLAQARMPADGEIRLLTIPRVFGYGFNPIAFWFCHDRAGALRALYADVLNILGAHRGYLLSAPDHAPIDDDTVLTCCKTLHVSPFCDVRGDYAFRVRRHDAHLSVAIDYHDDDLLIRTAIGLCARPLTGARVAHAPESADVCRRRDRAHPLAGAAAVDQARAVLQQTSTGRSVATTAATATAVSYQRIER